MNSVRQARTICAILTMAVGAFGATTVCPAGTKPQPTYNLTASFQFPVPMFQLKATMFYPGDWNNSEHVGE